MPLRGTSNEYPQHVFMERNKKNISTFGLTYLRLFYKAGALKWIIDQLIDKFHKIDYHYRFANNRSFDFCVCHFTLFTLSSHTIQTPQFLTIFYIKFEQVQFATHC